MRRSLLLAPLVVLMVAACGSDDDDAATSEPPGTPPPTSAPPSAFPATTARPPVGSLQPEPSLVAPEPEPSISRTGPTGSSDEVAAITDLAAGRGIDPSAVTVISTEEVTWRNGAVGCPQDGMIYTEALVPGVRIVLEFDGQRYQYHAGGGRPPFLCEQAEPPAAGD